MTKLHTSPLHGLERVLHEGKVTKLQFSNDGRLDAWLELAEQLKKCQTTYSDLDQIPAHQQETIKNILTNILPYERLHAFPGKTIVSQFISSIESSDLSKAADLAKKIYIGLLKNENLIKDDSADKASDANSNRPNFEVLIVINDLRATDSDIQNQLLEQRDAADCFVYDIVTVSSYEDAVQATLNNGNIQSIIVFEDVSTSKPELAGKSHADIAFSLVKEVKKIRPELDIFIVSEEANSKLAVNTGVAEVSRIFYQLEEFRELHLCILQNIKRKFETPFFNILKSYSRRPMGTFHALPVARGKSILKSSWVKDFGEFYGLNLFLAESSATTGGLDSLLEPTGNIKKAQDAAARAFGADHCYFVTNGTSTSNKIVEMGLLTPGDIVLMDRDCHKSHHYGMVQTGAEPLYVEAYPMQEYSMYGGVPLKTLKEQLLLLKKENKLDKVKMIVLTNCTFDGHVFNPYRVMEECLAIKPDLYFLWDEAWFGFARFSPLFRERTAMDAAKRLRETVRDPKYKEAYQAQMKRLGGQLDPNNPALLNEHLLMNPDQVRVRVYETNSTHKSMSAFRQASMILVSDQDYHLVEETLHEAVFTYASTSPNMQLIASIDVARRQMELEGYKLVMHATQLACDLRTHVNSDPLISKFFRMLTLEEMVPAEYRKSGLKSMLDVTTENWNTVLPALAHDEFILDPTRVTLVTGYAGFDGTQFKQMLTDKYDIQLNKTSRNSVLIQININNTRSDIAHLVQVLSEISQDLNDKYGESLAKSERVNSLMKNVPEMPNFSRFHDSFRSVPTSKTVEGDIRTAFYMAFHPENCEHIKLHDPEIDRRLKEGPELISANFVIPYPPGFPIMVPGQVITQETITFMRKLDVKEIHGYEKEQGLKLLKLSSQKKNQSTPSKK